MSEVNLPTKDPLIQLAMREYSAARHGGRVWVAFVAECENILRQPWVEIRERFNDLHRRGIVGPGRVWP